MAIHRPFPKADMFPAGRGEIAGAVRNTMGIERGLATTAPLRRGFSFRARSGLALALRFVP
jgi:hypothetical protein